MMARPRPETPYRFGLPWRIALPSSANATKKIIDHGLLLSIKELFDRQLIEQNAFHSGTLSWQSNTSQFHGPVRFEADLRKHEAAFIRLDYKLDGMRVDYSIGLAFIQPPFGGRRWYFCCPIMDIRVTKLFLPPGARRFASRQAHGLPDSPIRAKRMRTAAAEKALLTPPRYSKQK
jgi:hypothetical protein